MAVDTPATIAVIGAGPIGLEAALYARFLGYDVCVYERGRVADNLLTTSAAPHGFLWRESTSRLGIAAIAAQRPDWIPPAPDAALSGEQLVREYWAPLAESDLLADHVLVGAEVLSIEQDISPDEPPPEDDDLVGFRIRLRDAEGERREHADVVIDASGRLGRRILPETSPADFYVLGAKSAPGDDEFRFSTGLAQIRDLFQIVADRAGLDLYATIR